MLQDSPTILEAKKKYKAPGSSSDNRSMIRRFAGRLGLDFVVAGIKFANRQLGKSAHEPM